MEKTNKYDLTLLAENDLESIFDYTINKWGEQQATDYTNELFKRFEWLAENSNLGKKRDEVSEGYLSYFEGSHTIFFRETNVGIEILGIPHQSEDIGFHFEIDNLNPSYKDLLSQVGEQKENLQTPEQANDDLEL
ncbi:hypothetical protein MNBD_GAMMA12-71 [hydrothermal vent metagenome]|uniref:Toxin n=1 Tax=hydrothermal vent metagenome TaxID=652676 RepID=A0A3B0Y8C6_9ZZZZ